MILNIICLLVFLTLGLGFILFSYNPNYFFNFLKDLIYLSKDITVSFRIQVLIIGTIFILVAFKIFESFFGFKKEKVIKLNTKHGELTIFISAIEDMILRHLCSRKELTHIKPQVDVNKKCIEVIIKANFTSEMNILDFVNEAQREIKEKLNNILGEDKEIKIKFEIRKIVFSKNKSIQEELQVPFRNY